MRYKQFGKNGPKVSEIGMGTYYDPFWIVTAYLGWRRGIKQKIGALITGLSEGITLIDTAEIYRSETVVAEAIKGFKREDLFIATKVWSNHLRREKVFKSLKNSLSRLQTGYVDLYQIHFPNNRVPIAETMGAMEELVDQGKVRYIGVSNFSLEQTIEANSALKKYELASTQMNYSLANRTVEADILPYCEKQGMAVMAYFPLAHGKLAFKRSELATLMQKHSKTAAQIALNWLCSKQNVFPIPRASNPLHVKENLGASGWEISYEDAAELERLFPQPSP
jgi:diketogulonate reductase-like aldo/keto reductase